MTTQTATGVLVPELHPAIGRNSFCGPGALAILTGKSTDEGAAMLRQLTGRRAIYGSPDHAMRAALTEWGLPPYPVNVMEAEDGKLRPLLERWARRQDPARYLVVVANHYVVVRVDGDGAVEVGDNQSIHAVPLDKFVTRRRARRRVKDAWRV